MNQPSPYELAAQKRDYVLGFLRECVIQEKPSSRREFVTRIIPARYLCWLYNEWLDARGIDRFMKLSQERFTYIINTIEYARDNVFPLPHSRRTRAAIICFEAELHKEPLNLTDEEYELLGARLRLPFKIPTQSETPPSLLSEIYALQPILKRVGKRVAERNRAIQEDESYRAETRDLLKAPVELTNEIDPNL